MVEGELIEHARADFNRRGVQALPTCHPGNPVGKMQQAAALVFIASACKHRTARRVQGCTQAAVYRSRVCKALMVDYSVAQKSSCGVMRAAPKTH